MLKPPISLRDFQAVAAAFGAYHGDVDGLDGPLTRDAEENIRSHGFRPLHDGSRNRTAMVQFMLNAMEYAAGVVDGLNGHNTSEALNDFYAQHLGGTARRVSRPAARGYGDRHALLPTQDGCRAFYGDPEREVPDRVVTVGLPFSLRLDYDLGTLTSRITLHEMCADQAVAALTAVRKDYGEDRWRRLGLDRYAGGYMKRRMRGGSAWSMHAYGCAMDFFAWPNRLKLRCPDALFCGEAYRPFLDIMEDHGWLPAIRLWGADAMHFQMARL